MCDFSIMEKALKIAWVDRIRDQTSASWKVIPDHGIRENGNLAFLLTCNYSTNLLNLDKLPPFYRTVLTYWQEFKHMSKSNAHNYIVPKSCGIIVRF